MTFPIYGGGIVKSLGDMIARTYIDQFGGDSFGDRSSNSFKGKGGRSGSNGLSLSVSFVRGEVTPKKRTSTQVRVTIKTR